MKLPTDIPLNDRKALREMLVEWGFPMKHKEQRPRGFWVPYAWAVRATVESMGGGRIAMTAIRAVLRKAGIPVTKENEESLRMRYLAVCKQPWPEGMEQEIAKRRGRPKVKAEPEPEVTAAEPEPEVADPEPEVAEPEPELPEPDDEEDFLDPELRAELERELQEGYIPDPE